MSPPEETSPLIAASVAGAPASPSPAVQSATTVDGEPAPGDKLYIVGVGASAGGLEALQRLFTPMRLTGSYCFVVVQHLSPDFKSVMGELLAPHTELAVKGAEDGMLLEPDTIYLMPAKHEITVAGGRLHLAERDPGKGGLFMPVDTFLRSLGEDAGARSVAIILSGTGSDGARGVRAVHEAGGLVLVQSEDSAKFDGMPRNAVDTGTADLVLPPEGLVDALLRYREHASRLDLARPGDTPGEALPRIYSLLQSECGVDFSEYKPSTVARRIERRLLLSDCRDLDQYLERLGEEPAELRLLYKDLLIGVTRFFRDPELFQRLRTDVVPELIRRLPPNEELRVWVAGCATGQEAYSVAMVVADAFRVLGRKASFRVFATDVHRASLELASAGRYGNEALAGVPLDMRERYFEQRGDGLHIVTSLRERVVFAHHNVIRDAPFTRLDLLTCRNLLIYLNPSAQRRVLSLFHFALKTQGVMVLGPSESPGPLVEEFASLDARWKIFRKYRDVRLASDLRLGGLSSPDGSLRIPGPRPPPEDSRLARGRDLLHKRYMPPAVVLDSSLRILHSFGGASELFTFRDGPPTVNLLDLLEGDLRYATSAAVKRAQKERTTVVLGGISAGPDGKPVKVVVEPVEAGKASPGGLGNDDGWLVVFEPDAAPAINLQDALPGGEDGAQRPGMDELLRERVMALESELRNARQSLQATVEEMETGNEELQATNEELIASNEELQSTNEELHSVNEELYTVNAEYQAKINELTELTADVNNLLDGTDVHTLFLDGDLHIRKFTPKIAQTFKLLPQDVGRRFDTFAHGLLDHDLFSDIRRVREQRVVVEREVRDRLGSHYFLRILPYQGREDSPGVVVTLIDISALKRAQHELALSEERYRTLIRSATAVFFTTGPDARFVTLQPEWQDYTGQGGEEQTAESGDGWLQGFAEEDRARVRSARDEALSGRKHFEVEARLFSRQHGEHRWCVLRVAPLGREGEPLREWVGHVIDVHQRRSAEAELHRKSEQVRGLVENSPAFIWMKDPSGRYLVAGQRTADLLGVTVEELIGKTDYDFLPVAEADRARAEERRVLATGETLESEYTRPVPGDEPQQRTLLIVRFPLRDDSGGIYAVANVATDITERKRTAEEARLAVERRDRFLAMLSHELRTPLGAILNASNLLHRQLKGQVPGSGLDIVRRQARHMARLIDDLLDIGRITRDELVIEHLLVDLRTLLQELVESYRPSFEQTGLALELKFTSNDLWVRGDSVRLRQVFANLLTNAVNYTPSGGRVTLTAGRGDGRAVVEVCDSGVGMAPEEIERVFELFYQAPQSLDRPRGGLGIGLTLAQRLARLHGGDLRAESEGRGCGSRFTVQVPLVDASEIREQAARASGPARRLRIAIVEDNADIRETLRDLLLLDGHEVFTAEEGTAGLQLILGERPDLALVDVGLPGLDGYEVARRAKSACGAGTRVVALTGYGRQEDRMKAIEAGFDEHFVKPVEVEALSRLLADVEARKRAES